MFTEIIRSPRHATIMVNERLIIKKHGTHARFPVQISPASLAQILLLFFKELGICTA